MENKVQKVEISHKTIIFTFFFLLFMLFLYSILDVILQFFVSLIIMASFNPIVTRLGRYRIPRAVAVIFVYLIFFLILGIAVYALIPALIEQTTSFVANLPIYLDNLGIPTVVREKVLSEFLVQIGGLPSQIAKTTISIFSNVLGVITVLIFAFYLLIYRNKFDDILTNFLSDEKRREVRRVIDRLETQLGGWARACNISFAGDYNRIWDFACHGYCNGIFSIFNSTSRKLCICSQNHAKISWSKSDCHAFSFNHRL